MTIAIQFAVRDSAGGLQRGTVAAEGSDNFIQVGAGDRISLNLSAADVAGYAQQGTDLVVTLVDGRTLLLAGYFNPAGPALGLYLSERDGLEEIMLTDDGTGRLIASYHPVLPTEKWSPLDGLWFPESDTLAEGVEAVDTSGSIAFKAGALLLGLGLADRVLNGGDDDGGGRTRIAPSVDNPDALTTLTTNTPDPTISITGRGEPGDQVTVTVGSETRTTTISADGTWAVRFDADALPADGSYSSVVVVTEPGGIEHVLDGPDYTIDMSPPAVALTEGVESVGDLENLADYADGITISGVGEPGATLLIEVEGQTREVFIEAPNNMNSQGQARSLVGLCCANRLTAELSLLPDRPIPRPS